MTDLRLRHLWSASHTLASTSPHLSSFYMFQFMKHATSKELNLSDGTRRVFCSFCGSVFLPGVNCTIQIIKKHRKKGKKDGDSKHQEENRKPQHPPIQIPYHDYPLAKSRNYISYTCKRCARQTRFQGSICRPPQNSSVVKTKAKITTTLPSSTSVQETSSLKNKPTPGPAAALNTGKKKKGKKMDLKSLLAKEKEKAAEHGKGLSLGLEDFLSTI